ncbi:MAG TPA: S16 family serine protease, partial [Candidatus Binatia bacterium]|nr:S16 family serine protease [Candidatus Binatia bacterium]
METIRFDGYTTEEKLGIARGYLWPRQVERNGLRSDEVTIDDELLRLAIADYTREAGVRQLERELGTLLRRAATVVASKPGEASAISIDEPFLRQALGRKKFHQEAAARTSHPGVATGLAVTGTGGEVLFVEAASMGGSGALVLTGHLGDVMKESARIALTYVRSRAAALGIDERSFAQHDFHLHVPAGATPKDGPSAGVTMVTALASLLSNRPVKNTVGMTGEVTLQGRVLPIGGLKQKVLAAQAAGLTDVVLPERNAADLEEIPAEVRERMRFHPVTTIDEVLDIALEPAVVAMAA